MKINVTFRGVWIAVSKGSVNDCEKKYGKIGCFCIGNISVVIIFCFSEMNN
jgi:hypothetical protein